MSSHVPKNILVFGATGVIGRYIVQAIVESKSSFGRIAAFTSPKSVADKSELFERAKDKGVEIITGDLTNEEEIQDVYKGFDTVVSALGRTAIQLQIPLIKVAEESSTIKRFFTSEYGTDIEYFPNSSTEKPHQQKLKVRAYIRDNVKRLEHTYLVTGPYPEMYMMCPSPATQELGGFNVKERKTWLLGDGKGKVSFTTMPDVGKLLVAALKHPDASRNAVLKVNSFTTTPNEILAEFEKQMGAKWEVHYTSLEELKNKEKEAWDAGVPYATSATLRRIWTESGTLYEKRDNGKIGLKDEDMGTLPEVVAGVIKNQMEGTEKFY